MAHHVFLGDLGVGGRAAVRCQHQRLLSIGTPREVEKDPLRFGGHEASCHLPPARGGKAQSEIHGLHELME